MKTRDLAKIGIPAGRCAVLDDLRRVATSPAAFLDDATYVGLAHLLVDRAAAEGAFVPR